MANEQPAYGKPFIISFQENNPAYPVLAVPKQPTANGYRDSIPAVDSQDGLSVEAKTLYPNHRFRNIQIAQPDALVYWIYDELPGPVLTEYDQDEETLGLIQTDYQVVNTDDVVAPSVTPGTIIKYVKIDSQHSLKITRTISLPTGYTEQRIMAFSFPALFDYLDYSWSDDCGAFSQIRGAFSTIVDALVTISYTTTKQTFTPLSLIPKTLQLGRGVQIHDDVLVDSGTFTYTGQCVGTVSFSGSSPTYSAYVGAIQGTLQIVGGESVMWKARRYRNMKVEIIML